MTYHLNIQMTRYGVGFYFDSRDKSFRILIGPLVAHFHFANSDCIGESE